MTPRSPDFGIGLEAGERVDDFSRFLAAAKAQIARGVDFP